MTGLEQIYEQVYQQIKQQRGNTILTHERGLLHSIILDLVDEYDPQENNSVQSQLIFNEIRELKSTNSIDEDYQIIASLINIMFMDEQTLENWFSGLAKSVRSAGIKFFHFHHLTRKNQVRWFVIAGCMIVGIYVCLEYIKRRQKLISLTSPNNGKPRDSLPPASPPVSVALCLIVPASTASNFPNKIDIVQLKQLIDNASYFSCKSSSEANSREKNNLQILDEVVPIDSQKEVYIRIDIKDGKPIIDRTTRYELKENLYDSVDYEITQKACLGSLSGLESFIRI